MERGAVLACQFHPELSSKFGIELIQRWLDASTGRVSTGNVDSQSQVQVLNSPFVKGGDSSSKELIQDSGRSLTVRVIPCLDVRDGRVVKGIRFQGLKDAGSPPDLAGAYEQQGADEITILDVSATPEGRATAVETVRKVRERLSLPVTVGGGVRNTENAGALLDAGADKVGVNTAAVEHPSLLNDLASRFGCQCTVLAIDAATTESGGFEVVTLSGRRRTGIDAIEWAKEAVSRGAGEILLTSWDRDGTKSGYDLELITRISEVVEVPIIASGGAATPEHMVQAVQAGADAVLAASIFHYGEYTVHNLKTELQAQGVEVRI
ncbi:MAG: imidazole glycerol phosphate synthase subunit HisF [Proteobacteria bacterium]|nr:imidazole glycerol phosphate synthase subunit HisF [Pseudomonadota bacterium]